MAVTYGFYNSLNKDRMYNAEQMSSIFNGIITDGVFSTIGDALMTVAGTGMQVIVKPGRAWFNGTWTLNDAQLPLDVPAADVSLTRIDAVILEVNSAIATRANSIKVLKGTPSANPVKPTLSATETLHQYALAYITVAAGVTSITAANIEVNVGKTSCPFITSVLQQTDITDLFNQWEAEFTAWFENVQSQLSGDIAANLQRQIDLLKVATGSKITDSTAASIGVAQDTTVDAALNSLAAIINMIKNDTGMISITVKDSSGNFIQGISFENILDSNDNPVVTDSNGFCQGFIANGEQTIGITKYADIVAMEKTITITKGAFHSLEFIVERQNFIKITVSKKVAFTTNVTAVNITCVGGGGGGGNARSRVDSSGGDNAQGAGGGGGYCTVQENVSFTPLIEYDAVVGAGGVGGVYSADAGGDGGETRFLGISASGGKGGAGGGGRGYYPAGGTGNGAGGSAGYNDETKGYGRNGTVLGYSSFTETTLYGGGGGAGLYGNAQNPGGKNYGAKGQGNSSLDGCDAQDGFGGGGGGGHYRDSGSLHQGGKGGSGCIAIRMTLILS